MVKRLVLLLALAPTTVFAQTVPQCVSEHFARAKQYPDISYERDRQIVTIWCTCMVDQTKSGKPTDKAVEYCASATNEPINNYLRTR